MILIMSEDRYTRYMEMLEDEDAVFEEYVCDVLAGMVSDLSEFEDIQNMFWNSDFETIDKFDVATYAKSADAGGVNTDVKFSISYNDDGTPNTVIITEDIFKGHENEKPHKVIRDYLKKHIGEYATIIESGQKVYFGKDLPGEYTQSRYANTLDAKSRSVKNQTAQNLQEIVEIASSRQWEKNKKKKHSKNAKYGWYKYQSNVRVKGDNYTLDVLIRNDENGKKYLYDILNIKKVTPSRRTNVPQQQNLAVRDSDYNNSISEIYDNVNGDKVKFSLDKPVEYVRDLVATHNLTEDKLIKSLELGGLPMPSIAISKSDDLGSNSIYGDISLVFS